MLEIDNPLNFTLSGDLPPNLVASDTPVQCLVIIIIIIYTVNSRTQPAGYTRIILQVRVIVPRSGVQVIREVVGNIE